MLAQLVEHSTFNAGVLGSSPKQVTKKADVQSRALKKVLLTKASQINTNEGCSRFLDILHFFDSQAVDFSP